MNTGNTANTANTALNPPTSTLTDEEIVTRVRAGETHLFELIMRRNNRRIYRTARAIVRDDAEAEDVMQDAYVRAYAHLHEFEGRARFSTWLTRIAVHEALARVRRGRRFESLDARVQETPPMSPMSNGPRPSPEQLASDGEVRGVLEEAIDGLPEEFRAVFVLRAVEELTGAETAACLEIPEETVKTRLFRARARLQEVLLQSLEPVAPHVYEFHLSRCDRVVAAVLARINGGPLL